MELTKEIREILEDIVWWDTCPTEYKSKINAYLKRENGTALNIDLVSGWVSIESNIMPDKCSEVVIMYKDKTKAVAFFDGDGRFYIEKTDCDVTCIVVKWHKLP